VARIAALVLLVLGLLPVANWIPGGHEAPWYRDRIDLWLSGGAILGGAAVILWMAFRRHPALWREGGWQRLAERWYHGARRADALVAGIAGVVYATISQVVLAARPLLIDEVIQLWQARVFATGRLFLPVSAHPEFTAAMHLVDTGDKVYGQFPAGGPAMLSLGALFGVAWLVGPLFAAIGVYCFARLVRLVEPGQGTALAALLLFAFAPFTLFLSGSMMNHVTTTTWLLGAALALVLATRDDTPRLGMALVAGLCLGVAATIRPLDAVAFALPAAVWLLWRATNRAALVPPLLASGVGVAIPIAALLAINATWTGDPFRFGYIELWGVTHELGFHEAPWGFSHTPMRGVELINLYLLRLQTYMFETPAPALLFATLALLLVRRISAFDRWALTGSALLLLAYFAYWHDGFYLGPRFMLPLAPWLALWTARLPMVLRERRWPLPVQRATVAVGGLALMIGAVQLLPIRWQQYRNGMLSMRFDTNAAATAAGVPDSALVLVRESWGAQLIARMWGLGVSRPEAERIYRRSDACTLDRTLDAAEREGDDASRFIGRITPFLADTSALLTVRLSPDTTLKALPGAIFTEKCRRRLAEELSGTAVYAPLINAAPGRRYVRDLHARDSLLPQEWWRREVWLLTQSPETGGALRFERLNLDSMRQEWALP
jgi:hypothetical protein